MRSAPFWLARRDLEGEALVWYRKGWELAVLIAADAYPAVPTPPNVEMRFYFRQGWAAYRERADAPLCIFPPETTAGAK